MKKRCYSLIMATILSLLCFCPIVEGADMVDQLIEQLQGKKGYFDSTGKELGSFASWTTRHYDEVIKIYAAKLLTQKITPENRQKVVDALLDALKNGAEDRDTGDGIILNRSEIALALGMIGDESSIDPLLHKLCGTEKLPMVNSKGDQPDIIVRKTTSNLNIIKALGGFTGEKAIKAANVMQALSMMGQDKTIEDAINESINLIRNGSELPKEMLLMPIRGL
ncbi:MAG: HEAT repeat domain-containing protein [Candidatus Rifleibacteriota bacterium]